jgi:2-enoate reductase
MNPLFEPIQIGKVEIKNRIAMAPMGVGAMMNPDGSYGPRALDYFAERVRGGVGLIITNVFKVENECDPLKPGMGFPLLSHACISGFSEIAELAHAFGARIFVQLSAGFGRAAMPLILRGRPGSASAVPNYWDPSITCRELSTEEVETMVKTFGPAAEMLARCGIDGVELHGHEGYLLDQFMTALWNRRTDKYGGDMAGRITLLFEILHEIRKYCGRDFPVQYRFGLKHYIKGFGAGALPGEEYEEAGRDVEEGLQIARMLEKEGFDSLHVDAGCYDSWYWAHPPGYHDYGCMVDMAAKVKKVVGVPVIAVGRLEVPDLAERVVREGKADMIAIGRGLLSDPFWARKVAEGRPNRIRPCIGCHDGCMGRLTTGKVTSCSVNPSCGRERSYALTPAHEPRRVMIVGGGVAGMEAGRVAALRGHGVTLYEKSDRLGGHVAEAAMIPFKTGEPRLLDWYKTELEELRLDIRMKIEVTPDLIDRENPDVIIVATGSIPIVPDVPGIHGRNVVSACDLIADGRDTGARVVVVGGGQVGCETALWLAQKGKMVTVIERLNDVLVADRSLPHMNRIMLLDLMKYHKVEVITGAALLEATEQEAVIERKDFRRDALPADTVVLAAGLSPVQGVYRALQGRHPDLYLIGDARAAKNIMNAVWDAYEVARAI